MTYAVYLPLILPALLAVAARRAGDRLGPRNGAVGLTLAGICAAAATVWALALLALTLFDDLPSMSARAPGLPEPVPDWVALTAAAAIILAAGSAVQDLHQRRSPVRLLRSDQAAAGDVVMAADDEPLAVALPGRPGRILLTTGMVRLLGPRERSAVLAHERAHLTHRHHLLMATAGAAAAINPLLRPVRDSVAYLIERWADEEAATELGDRDLVARAVAKAALATTDRTPALGVHGGVVVRRVRALRCPPRPVTGRTMAALVVTAATAVAAAIIATSDFVVLLHTWLVA
ncbi:M56 family metallopeptidase [Actinoplanes sp. TBRC 11911]|uniref:M56 family metallopeptidase n=1 Tax=Actinoplanes sp. TBRC 11911 TaxID=2729386 RepID=UPI00145D08D3|nr:M56 family metallopeptidase [Actinoplanes sp. TBRC 11911]NMO56210.1 M56 family metallopeptidase [Actinoplanes sp. TBRC 11911]